MTATTDPPDDTAAQVRRIVRQYWRRALAPALVIDLLFGPWFGSGGFSASATAKPYGYAAWPAVLCAVALAASLIRYHGVVPTTPILRLRFPLAGVAAISLAAKAVIPTDFSQWGWGFYLAILLDGGLLYLTWPTAVRRAQAAKATVEAAAATAVAAPAIAAVTSPVAQASSSSSQTSAGKAATTGPATGSTPSKTGEKLVIAGAMTVYYVGGGVLALAAVVGGGVLKSRMPPLVEACNAASSFGDTGSASHSALCGLYSFGNGVAPFLEYGGIACLVLGGLKLIFSMGLLPKVWREL